MLAIEKRGVAGVDSAPNPRVIKPAVQQRRQNVEIFTAADLTELSRQHKCAPQSILPGKPGRCWRRHRIAAGCRESHDTSPDPSTCAPPSHSGKANDGVFRWYLQAPLVDFGARGGLPSIAQGWQDALDLE